ncbi:MAG: hypothetical protein NTV56_00935, partial [Alphaproteobacteria bacterium]|nr:hypothetical protein [Alphaproteobacteria bacterium]
HAAAAGAPPVGLRPPFVTPAAAHSHPDCRGILTLIVAPQMSCFHVRRSDGQLVSGAAAFVSIWSQLLRWRWAARIAELLGAMALLEGGYRLFLPARPTLAWAFRKIQASKQKHDPVDNRDVA